MVILSDQRESMDLRLPCASNKKDVVILSDKRESKDLRLLCASNWKIVVILSDQRESKDLRFRMPTLYYELKGRHAGTNRNK